MRLRLLPVMSAVLAGAAAASGCQLLYEKNDLTVATGGGTTTSNGGAGGTTSASSTSMGGGGMTTSTGEGGSTTTSTGGGGSATTSAGGGGTTTTETSAGGGGAGGGTTSTTSSTTDECADDRLFVVGTSDTSVLCGTFAMASGWTTSTDGAGHSSARPAAVLVDAQNGIGIFYQEDPTTPGKGPLRQVELAGGACQPVTSVGAVITKAAPSAAVLAGKVHALFQGTIAAGDDNPFHWSWDPAGGWVAGSQVGTEDSFAVSGIAASGAQMLAVHSRSTNSEITRTRYEGGAWLSASEDCFKNGLRMCELSKSNLTPGVAGLDSGGWIVVFHDFSNSSLRWLKSDGTSNAPSDLLAGATSDSEVALARVVGGAVLAFRGQDNKVYAAAYESLGNTWGTLVKIGDDTTVASPAVAAGVCTHRAELVYIDTAGVIKHSSLEGMTWTAPAPVGGTAMKGVALSSAL